MQLLKASRSTTVTTYKSSIVYSLLLLGETSRPTTATTCKSSKVYPLLFIGWKISPNDCHNMQKYKSVLSVFYWVSLPLQNTCDTQTRLYHFKIHDMWHAKTKRSILYEISFKYTQAKTLMSIRFKQYSLSELNPFTSLYLLQVKHAKPWSWSYWKQYSLVELTSIAWNSCNCNVRAFSGT